MTKTPPAIPEPILQEVAKAMETTARYTFVGGEQNGADVIANWPEVARAGLDAYNLQTMMPVRDSILD